MLCFFQKGGSVPPKSARLFSCSCHQRTYFVRREEPGTLENLLNSEDGYATKPRLFHKRRQGSIWGWFLRHITSLFACTYACNIASVIVSTCLLLYRHHGWQKVGHMFHCHVVTLTLNSDEGSYLGSCYYCWLNHKKT